MKKCLYCGENIDPESNFEIIGKKWVCVLCYEEYIDELKINEEDIEEYFN